MPTPVVILITFFAKFYTELKTVCDEAVIVEWVTIFVLICVKSLVFRGVPFRSWHDYGFQLPVHGPLQKFPRYTNISKDIEGYKN